MPENKNAPACAPTQNRSETENLPTAKLEGYRSHEDTPACTKFQPDSTGVVGNNSKLSKRPSSCQTAVRANRSPISSGQSSSGTSGPRIGGRQMVTYMVRANFSNCLLRSSVVVTGRDAWALQQLVNAGPAGCTPIDNPAPRWSGYVFNLRQMGFDIETVHEPHKGQFPGTHARYILRSKVTLSEEVSEVTA